MAVIEVRRGDRVVILAGKEKGKRGKILRVLPKKERVVVEGLNLIKKAVKPTQKNPQGGIIDNEGSVNISNVMLLCPSCDEPSRIKHQITADGRNIRVCRKCEAEMDKG
ncbi:MAG TPA: 50S ribosomal protein L24 [Actinobacteria bacterium]|nr:50S ribosomal protein L24 [Actinomycetota bacterium]